MKTRLMKGLLTASVLAGSITPLSAVTYTVDNPGDVNDGDYTAGQFTLREALALANGDAAPDTINFAASVTTVTLVAGLPQIIEPLTIDGSLNATHVVLDGATNTVAATALNVATDDFEVYGMDIAGFSGRGIDLNGADGIIGAPGKGNVFRSLTDLPILTLGGASNTVIQSNIMGFLADGTTAAPNAGGVQLNGTGTLLGGSGAGEGNVISGATPSNGINVLGGSGHVIQGNYIGTDATGTMDFGNSAHGIYCQVTGTQIGGPNAGEGNVISGNGANGIHLFNIAGVSIQGNSIGLNAAGTGAIANSGHGIPCPVFGKRGTIRDNVISGNTQDGIVCEGDNISIHGNVIGLGADGDTPLGNGDEGVELTSTASLIAIGSSSAADRNVISANAADSVILDGTGATVQGNYIGTDATGAMARGNAGGVMLFGTGHVIGGGGAGEGNVISASTASNGVNVLGGSGHAIQGNYIGTDVTGTLDFGNAFHGVYSQVTGTQIGGAGAGEGNVISGNGANGIHMHNHTAFTIEGNIVGLNAAGTAALPNATNGITVLITNSGGTIRGNTISGNTADGINTSGDNIAIHGNTIGLGTDGDTDIGNGDVGIEINADANLTVIGSSSAADRNIVSGNASSGIAVDGTSTQVLGNYIGVDATGALARGNTGAGVSVTRAGNTIGGTGAGEGNVISGNALYGVAVSSAADTVVAGNTIGLNAAGSAAVSNLRSGIFVSGASNNSQITGNLVSANGIGGASSNRYGIRSETATGVVIEDNRVGTDSVGNAGLGNARHGISLASGSGTIGGTLAGEGNLVLGNGEYGIEVNSNTGSSLVAGNVVGGNGSQQIFAPGSATVAIQDNFVGTDETETATIACPGEGIALSGSGVKTVTGNVVANCAYLGISISSAGHTVTANMVRDCTHGIAVYEGAGNVGNLLALNSVFDTPGSSIAIGWFGPLSNDALDADAGTANNHQNHPLIGPVLPGDASLAGVLSSAAGTMYQLDFYRNTGCLSSGYGEAREWLGSANVTTDGLGEAPFMFALPSNAVLGESFAATATDLSTNDTSGISPCVETEADPRPDLAAADPAAGTDDPNYGPSVVFELGFDEPVTGVAPANIAPQEGGTLSGSTVASVNYPMGGAVQLGDTVALSTAAQLDLSNRSFTVEFWARRTNVTNSNEYVVHANASATTRNYLHLGFASGYAFRFGFFNDNLDTATEWGLENVWEHWACTYDLGTNARAIYHNGVLVGSDTAGGPLQTAAVFTVGAGNLGGFEGDVDEVRVWDSARTQGQIQGAMFEPATGMEAGLLALFQFDAFADLGVNADGADDIADAATGAHPLDMSGGAASINPQQIPATHLDVTVTTGTGDGTLGVAVSPTTGIADTDGFAMNTPAIVGDTVTVIENDTPTSISLDNDTLNHGDPIGTLVGNLSTTDPDNPLAGQAFTYALVAGIGDDDNGMFQITGSQLLTTAMASGPATLSIRVETTDDGVPAESFEQVLMITVGPSFARDWRLLED